MARRCYVMHYTSGLCKGRNTSGLCKGRSSEFRHFEAAAAYGRPGLLENACPEGYSGWIEPSSSASHINFDWKETTLAGDPLPDERSRVGRFGADGIGLLLGPRGAPGFRCGQRLVGHRHRLSYRWQ